MPEYIERERLLETAKELAKGSFSTPLIIAAIENAPKADVVEVVRCKDCVEWDAEDLECSHWYGMRKNCYCSYGYRKEGAEE